MSTAQTETETTVYCVNHPQTPTLLRCNRCGKPVCIRCVRRTPVGYRCKECLNEQQAGYYNAGPLDYALTGIVGFVLATAAAAIMGGVGGVGFFGIIIGIFAGPIAGGIIAEVIRAATGKRRGRYTWLIAVGAVILGGIIGGLSLPLLVQFGRPLATLNLVLLGSLALRAFFNLGLIVFMGMAVATVYARLRV